MGNSDQVAAVTSPATWHVVFWNLACLAISCMSQPRKRFCTATGRFRVYLVSSPILCAADTASTAIWIVTALFCLRGDLSTASQFALSHTIEVNGFRRLEEPEAFSEGCESDDEDVAEISNWLRAILFVIGTLPAAIKLGAQEGIPWSKAWGMMFVVNFVSKELVSLLSHIEEPAREATLKAQNRRMKLDLLGSKLDVVDVLLVMCASLVHAGLFIFALTVVWMKTIDTLWDCSLALSISSLLFYLRGMINACLIFYIGFSALLYSIRGRSRDKFSYAWRIFIGGICLSWVMIPKVRRNDCEDGREKEVLSLHKVSLWMKSTEKIWEFTQAHVAKNIIDWVKALALLGLLSCLIFTIMLYLILPLSGKMLWFIVRNILIGLLLTAALLPDFMPEKRPHKEESSPYIPAPPPWLARKGQYLLIWGYFVGVLLLVRQSLLKISKRWPRVGQILFIEPKKQKKQNCNAGAGADQDLPTDEAIINPNGCFALCFFISNLVACVLYYAFKYDPTDTINPSWTDVFG